MLRLEKAKPTAEAKTAELRHKLAKAATKGAKLALHHGVSDPVSLPCRSE